MEVFVLHFVFLLSEPLAHFVFQLHIRPVAVGVSAVSEACFRLITVVSVSAIQVLEF